MEALDVFGPKTGWGGSGLKPQRADPAGPSLLKIHVLPRQCWGTMHITQLGKVTVTLVRPEICIHQSKLQGTANGTMENAVGEVKMRGGSRPSWSGGGKWT